MNSVAKTANKEMLQKQLSKKRKDRLLKAAKKVANPNTPRNTKTPFL